MNEYKLWLTIIARASESKETLVIIMSNIKFQVIMREECCYDTLLSFANNPAV